MADLFSKSRIKKISSPDELDKMMVITPSSFWIAILGGALIILIALIWSIFGSLPQKITAQGIYIDDQDSYKLSSEVNGIVEEIKVNIGDEVSVGDILYTLDADSLEKEKKQLEERISLVESITLSSSGDTSNTDTTQLLEIKNQITSSGISVSQNESMLEIRQEDLDKQKLIVDAAYATMTASRKKLEEYQNTNSAIQEHYNQVVSAWNSRTQADASLTSAKTLMDEAESEMNAVSDYSTSTDPSEVLKYQTACNTYSSAVSAYNSALSSFQTADNIYSTLIKEYFPAADATKAPDKQTTPLISYVNEYNSMVADLSQQYEIDKSTYSTEYSKLTSLESEISSLDAQISAGSDAEEISVQTYKNQFEAMKESIITSLSEELEKYNDNIANNKVESTVSGIVSDIRLGVGSMVTQGTSTIVIRQSRNTGSQVLCYVSASTGKSIKPGMDVKIYPTTVNRQEYGNMLATVVSVDEYISTATRVSQQLGDETLGSLFTSSGPVLCVTCELEEDPESASGYKWSNRKGRQVEIIQETFVEADIITDNKKPITMLIPYLKEKLSSKMQKDDSEDK